MHLGAKYFRHGFVVEQVFAFFAAPTALFTMDGAGRHHQMHVRMVVKPARVGVQYRHGPGRALQLFIVLAEGIDGFPCTPGDQVIDDFLVLPCQLAPLLRQGEADHEVVARQLFRLLAFDPLLRFVGLAVRTTAVSAGMRDVLGVQAIGTLHLHARAQGVAAGFKGRQGAQLTRQERGCVLAQEVGFKRVDDVSEPDHLTLPQSMAILSIRALMRSMALSLLVLVRWV